MKWYHMLQYTVHTDYIIQVVLLNPPYALCFPDQGGVADIGLQDRIIFINDDT